MIYTSLYVHVQSMYICTLLLPLGLGHQLFRPHMSQCSFVTLYHFTYLVQLYPYVCYYMVMQMGIYRHMTSPQAVDLAYAHVHATTRQCIIISQAQATCVLKFRCHTPGSYTWMSMLDVQIRSDLRSFPYAPQLLCHSVSLCIGLSHHITLPTQYGCIPMQAIQRCQDLYTCTCDHMPRHHLPIQSPTCMNVISTQDI